MNNKQISAIFKEHADTVYRVHFKYFKGRIMGTEDAVQTVLYNLTRHGKTFESAGQHKPWFIVVMCNVCKKSLQDGCLFAYGSTCW